MSKPSIYFGAGSILELGNLYPDRRFHILRIPEISSEELKKIRSSLQGRIISETIYQKGMPDIASIQEFQDDFWSRSDLEKSALLGIGGGSIMDAAKVLHYKPDGLAWLGAHLDVSVEDESLSKIPLLLASTTAGTGSEVAPTATIWDFAKQRKHSFFGPEVFANVAIIDPCLCLGAPWAISCDSAVDALSHALEAIWNGNRSEETTNLAIFTAKKICHYLPLIRDNLSNLELREQLSEAALSAGLVMAKTQTALVHALSYSETIRSQKSHGQSCAYWLPYVWQLLIESDCDPAILSDLDHAIGQFFSAPIEMHQWLLALGFLVYPPLECDKAVEEWVDTVRLSARGKNFAGFRINGE
ncbi:iron-containing alcohol dehydrogenase [Polynucleobacter sp.]|jgi:alcohol dehydrogenase class IV|uniref:iron-containing alcohol dehydrogenase n=1 Tax=Polynucleobacter sp. TaxID=2029855 RepID=UPI0037C91830